MDYKTYCLNQAAAAQRYKSLKDTHTGEDLGQDAIVEWVEKYAKEYRENYERAYQNIIKRVTYKAKRILKQKAPSITDNDLETLAKIVVDQFTDIWTIEMSNEEHNDHIDEI